MFKPDFEKLPKNPIKALRDDLKFNIAQLARAADLSPQTLRDVELGLSKTIPDKLQEFFDIQFPENTLDVQYDQWKETKRKLVYLPPVGNLSISSDEHPMTQYRNKIGIGVAVLCEFLCIQRFVLLHYEQEQKRMPKLLREVLFQSHIKQHEIDKLANLGEMFHIAREQRIISEQRQTNSR